MRARPANPVFQNVPVDLLFGSSAVRDAKGCLSGTKMMALITSSTVAEVQWIQSRLTELIRTLAIPRETAVAMVTEELKEEPWKK
jgi:hypothetical protein